MRIHVSSKEKGSDKGTKGFIEQFAVLRLTNASSKLIKLHYWRICNAAWI